VRQWGYCERKRLRLGHARQRSPVKLEGASWDEEEGTVRRPMALSTAIKHAGCFMVFLRSKTSSPVVKPAMVRVVLSIALSLKWETRQLDVKKVFLHDKLSEVVYNRRPTSFINSTHPSTSVG
jgi:hypothetical protein